MASGGTIALRITDLIGEQYSTDATYFGDMINAAINEIADMIDKEMLLKYSKTPGILQSNSEWLVEDRKILKVTRVDSDSSGVERECIKVNRARFGAAGDSGSIHYATAYSPIYHLDSANTGTATLKILPEPGTTQKGRIWYFSYVADGTDSIGITQATVNSTLYLPSMAINAIALKSSINILNAYVSNQIQDEEDVELMQMIQNQIQVLEKSYLSEMQRFVDEKIRPGVE